MTHKERTEGMGFATQAIHVGVEADPLTGAVGPSIVTSCMFTAEFGDIGFSAAGTNEDKVPYAYAREGHPNSAQLERKLAILDEAEDAVVFSSGIAAISGLLLQELSPGDHVLISDVSYAGTAEFARGFLRSKGIDVSLVDMSDLEDIAAHMKPSTKIVYAETPCNPVLKLVDIAAVAELAHSKGAKLVIDGTFATPAVQKPITLGADYAVYSLTKYYAGHGDALGGAIVGRHADIDRIRRDVGVHLGANLSPFNCWLIMRGIETLKLRMAAYSQSAQKIAEFLEQHPFVSSVRFPGLKSHPQYEVAQKQMSLPSGMISFKPLDNQALGEAISANMKVFTFAASLGLSRSLILHCDTDDLFTTTFVLDEAHAERYRAWAGDGFFRLSIGLEDVEDLIADLKCVLDAAAAASQPGKLQATR
jgi:methionine-gamma-lyase